MWHECDIYYGSLSVAVGYSVTTSSSESLLNDREKPNQLNVSEMRFNIVKFP